MSATVKKKPSFGTRVTRWLSLILVALVAWGVATRKIENPFQPGPDTLPAPSVSPTPSPAAPLLPIALEPPPAKVCVKKYCGKQLAYASIIVDTGRRRTTLPRRGWEIAVTAAITASKLQKLANQRVPDSTAYPYDAMSTTAEGVGLFQLTSSWGNLSDRMDPRYSAQKFYDKLKATVSSREGWEDSSEIRGWELAHATLGSTYDGRYQDYEADAKAIVTEVLKYTAKKRDRFKENFGEFRYSKNSGAVMFQCEDLRSLSCEAIVWQMIQPVIDNREAKARWFPRMLYQGDLGNKDHQDAHPPQDHTPSAGTTGCFHDLCNIRGWIYAQDLGTQGDFNLPVFVRWLLDEIRLNHKYPCVKYIVNTSPENLVRPIQDPTDYYGFFARENNWVKENHAIDHNSHVHISYMPGCERTHENILLDYYNWQQTL